MIITHLSICFLYWLVRFIGCTPMSNFVTIIHLTVFLTLVVTKVPGGNPTTQGEHANSPHNESLWKLVGGYSANQCNTATIPLTDNNLEFACNPCVVMEFPWGSGFPAQYKDMLREIGDTRCSAVWIGSSWSCIC